MRQPANNEPTYQVAERKVWGGEVQGLQPTSYPLVGKARGNGKVGDYYTHGDDVGATRSIHSLFLGSLPIRGQTSPWQSGLGLRV